MWNLRSASRSTSEGSSTDTKQHARNQGASASQLAAATFVDTVSRLLRMAGEANDAVSAHASTSVGSYQIAEISRYCVQYEARCSHFEELGFVQWMLPCGMTTPRRMFFLNFKLS